MNSDLAALRAWYAGLSARATTAQYLGHDKASGQSSRAMLGGIRRQLAGYARERHREDLAGLVEHAAAERAQRACAVSDAIETLRHLPAPTPLVTDDVSRWLPARRRRHDSPRHQDPGRADGANSAAPALVDGYSWPGRHQRQADRNILRGAPHLTQQARALVPIGAQHDVVPWERLRVPHEVDGSRGAFRAPKATCTLDADNDYEAVQAWLALHESSTTQRAYRKEAERLILWAVVERG